MKKVMESEMKKVIGGKRFNTETAQYVGSYESDLAPTEHGFLKEDLYIKKTGDFFLHGMGGGLTKYAKSYGDAYGFGEKILPISINEAKIWVENHMTADEYEELFDIIDDDNVGFNLLLPESVHADLKARADKEGKSMKSIAVSALREYLK